MTIKVVDEGTEREQIIVSAAGCANTYYWLDRSALCWRRESNGSGRQITVFDMCTYYPEVKDLILRRTREAIMGNRAAMQVEISRLRMELFVAERS